MKTEIARRELITSRNEKKEFVYYLIENEDAESGEICFGIEISESSGGASSCIKNITSKREKVKGLIEKLADGTVTPVTLYDIVYDWVCFEAE